MLTKNQVYDLLKEKNISYEVFEHQPVYTIEDMVATGMPHVENIVKNLFLRDDKGKNHYLITLDGHKSVDLKEVADKIGSRKLSFASEDRLMKNLGLTAGSVTPLGLLNDAPVTVTLVFDKALKGKLMGIHPMENTATIFIKYEDLYNLIFKSCDNDILVCEL